MPTATPARSRAISWTSPAKAGCSAATPAHRWPPSSVSRCRSAPSPWPRPVVMPMPAWRPRPARRRRGAGSPTTPWSVEQHHRVRSSVFVEEQGLFLPGRPRCPRRGSVDLKVLGLHGREPAGAVRLFPLDPDGLRWQGDRLAVLPAHRRHRGGAPLVRFAVQTASEPAALMVPTSRWPTSVLRAAGWRRGRLDRDLRRRRAPADGHRLSRRCDDRRQAGDALDAEVDHVSGVPPRARSGHPSRSMVPRVA